MANDGGPAFPHPEYVSMSGGMYMGESSGMSLRDYFAGQALVGLALAVCIAKGEMLMPDRAAPLAYDFADAMLKAREGQ